MHHFGLVGYGRSLEWYASWDMPLPAAHGMPYARGPALDLCTDAMAFFFVFDDQFDGPLGRDPARVVAVCRKLIDIVHGAPAGPGADACSRAFSDIRTRSLHGSHPGWAARTAHEWEYYFATQAHEAIGRTRGTPGDLETYLQVRRGIAGTAVPLSLGEHATGLNVAAVREEVARRTRRFVELAAQVPDVCTRLGLTGRERAHVRTYVEVMEWWMSGYHAWQTRTRRYTGALRVLPRTGPGYFDETLPP
ncbi:terpene synthase family protein [Streptomyces sp. CA-243310]|uniref:terpene synthase family protein n=1 Tax=Streptomyces sp. CA-243310 TaxID=3240056 RepID=UPI003D914FE5